MGEPNLPIRIAVLLGLMAALALVETLIPFRAHARRRGRIAPNLALTALFLAVNLALAVALAALAMRPALHGTAPAAWAIAGGVVVLDGAAYLVHVLLHKVPALWRLHRVHHSDREIDVTTAYRQHPLETVLRFAFAAAPALALGMPAETVALYRLLSGTNALLEHANLRVPRGLERVLGWLVVTPPMHKVHHSRAQAETDSNYSNIFSIFDRLFGTWRPPAHDATIVYGLDESNPLGDLSFGALLKWPWSHRPADLAAAAQHLEETP
jgi:sterol desaturase/sphingolipid hydroxylase (fatty acid hydroxylase superfamily)